MSRRNKTFRLPGTDYRFWDSLGNNDYATDFYTHRLIELGMSMFEWKNLPKPIDWRFIEYTMMYQGEGVFFKEEVLDEYAFLQATLSGKYDFYRVPNDRQVYSVSGYQRKLTAENSVIIWNNVMRTPALPGILYYARKLADIDRIMDINLNAQKTPILLVCDEDDRLTVKNAYMQYDGNQPVIYGTKNLDLMNKITVFKTDAPYLLDKLNEQKNQYWNDALTYLGISNVNMQKKERLITDEVTRSMGGVIASRTSRLEMRREACDNINRMFGLNIDVDFRQDYRVTDEMDVLEDDTGGKGVDKMIETVHGIGDTNWKRY